MKRDELEKARPRMLNYLMMRAYGRLWIEHRNHITVLQSMRNKEVRYARIEAFTVKGLASDLVVFNHFVTAFDLPRLWNLYVLTPILLSQSSSIPLYLLQPSRSFSNASVGLYVGWTLPRASYMYTYRTLGSGVLITLNGRTEVLP